MESRLHHYRLFFQEFRRTFYSTGAVLPSGRRLARALARHVAPAADQPVRPARRILEVGPGTGVVTDQIIKRLGPHDTLDLVELNDRFVATLERRFQSEADWGKVSERIRLHHQPIEEHQASPYDAIVSGLPLNNFPADAVRAILSHLAHLAAPGSTLSFFEYIAVRKVKSCACGKDERRRLAEVARVLEEALGRWQFDRECIIAIIPPAWVNHLRFPS